MLKKYEVSISDNGICSKCKMVTEQEYNQLKQVSEQVLAKEKAEIKEIKDLLNKAFAEIDKLLSEIKILKGEE